MTDDQMPPIKPLLLRDEDATRRWLFTDDWYFYFPPMKTTFFIPKGYIINGASIPGWAQGIYSPVGFLFLGSIMHDYFYDKASYLYLFDENKNLEKKISKKHADQILKDISKYVYPKKWFAAGVAHRTLSIGGQGAWDKCRKADGTYVEPEPYVYWGNVD